MYQQNQNRLKEAKMTEDARNLQPNDLLAQRLATANLGDSSSNRERISQRVALYRKLQKAAKQHTGDLRKRLSVYGH
jgi:hypothetical protein